MEHDVEFTEFRKLYSEHKTNRRQPQEEVPRVASLSLALLTSSGKSLHSADRIKMILIGIHTPPSTNYNSVKSRGYIRSGYHLATTSSQTVG